MRAGYGRGLSLVFGVTIGIPMFVFLANLPQMLKAVGWVIVLVAAFSIVVALVSAIKHLVTPSELQGLSNIAKSGAGLACSSEVVVADDWPTPAVIKAGFDRRFTLIDRDGRHRYAQIYKGTFQVGKARIETPTDLACFARSILVDCKDGRFTCADKSQHGILKYGRRAARSYVLDLAIAKRIGVPSRGSV